MRDAIYHWKAGADMDFDIRLHDYTFKHTFSPVPDLNADRYKEHFHTGFELLYFMRGDADFMVQHTIYKIRPGSLLIAKPGEYHNIVFHSAAPYERYVIRFNPFSIYPYLRKQLEKAESVYFIEGSPLVAEFARIDEFLSYIHQDVYIGACIGSLNIIIAYLISSQSLTQVADYVDEDAKRIVEYIDAHLPEIQSSDDLARALHMSKSGIYKIFDKQFQTPLMTYIRTQKCMLAHNLITDGVTATEAAERLGFNHYSSFYREYVKIFGTPPTTAKNG